MRYFGTPLPIMVWAFSPHEPRLHVNLARCTRLVWSCTVGAEDFHKKKGNEGA
jgi:hypothetical protein